MSKEKKSGKKSSSSSYSVGGKKSSSSSQSDNFQRDVDRANLTNSIVQGMM